MNIDLTQKYEPQSFDDIQLPKDIRELIDPSLTMALPFPYLLMGPAGTGKTLVAKLLKKGAYFLSCLKGCSDDELYLLEKSAASLSLDGQRKMFILDDVDHMLPKHQLHLKYIFDKFLPHSDFVLTAIEPYRLKDTIRSRLQTIDFGISESKPYRNQLVDWLGDIALKEGSTDIEGLEIAKLVRSCYPDIRKMLRQLQALIK